MSPRDGVNAVGFPIALALRLAAVAMALALGRRPAPCRAAAFSLSALASMVTAAAGMAALGGAENARGVLLVHEASGFTLGWTVDALSAWFLVVLGVLAVPVAVYSVAYAAHAVPASRTAFLGVTFNLMVGAVELVLVADGVVGFLFAWELMTLATAALVATEHEKQEATRAAYLFLVMSHVGTGCLIAAMLLLGAAAGSLSFAPMLALGAAAPHRDLLFVLFLAGFGIKAGIIPLHIWLPDAHPAAPSNVSAFMSGVLIKTGIYGIVRFGAFGLGTPRLGWGLAVMLLGGLSAVLGVLYALVQHDLKRLLAYHSIENVGIILLGLGAGMMALAGGHGELAAVGFIAALYHVLNHAVFKGLLFLGAGSVVMATGTRQVEEMGGLVHPMPWTAACFLVGAAAISGLPLLNGFASEWLVFQSFLFGFQSSRDEVLRLAYPLGGALLALTSGLAAACFVKAFGITFLALPRGAGARGAREVPRLMLAPQVFLAALCFALGLFPAQVVGVLRGVVAGLPGVTPAAGLVHGAFGVTPGSGTFGHLAPLPALAAVAGALLLAVSLGRVSRYKVRRAPTWGCGGALDARTEYTATAFSKPLLMIFSAIYRPTREVSALSEVSRYFPREVRYSAHVEPTFERFVYQPLTRAVLGLAERMKVIQAGSLHAYLAYVILLVVGLVVWLGWER